MPLRPFSRDQVYLLPPSLDDWLPADHPLRYVAAFVASLPPDDWELLGIDHAGADLGAPAYHPDALLAVWLAGFMSGVRSARKLETACRDQIGFRWISGNQTPDHNTLWRFYQRHRREMRQLLRRTVETALAAGLVDLALVAVDSTTVGGNADRERMLDRDETRALLAAVDAAIVELEARNQTSDEPGGVRLPGELADANALRERISQALQEVEQRDPEGTQTALNRTDPDARLRPSRQGWVAGYRAQTAVSETPAPAEGEPGGRMVLATAVTMRADDHGELLPLVETLEAEYGRAPDMLVADGGYHDGATLSTCRERGYRVVLPEGQVSTVGPFHKDRFGYDAQTDTFTCPEGAVLTLRGTVTRTNHPPAWVYRGSAAQCRSCRWFGTCTTNRRQGRSIEVGPHERALQEHREWMSTAEAQEIQARRKGLVEPVFGLLKEHHGMRRCLLRGLERVQAEWTLGAVGLNLKTLARYWSSGQLGRLQGQPTTG